MHTEQAVPTGARYEDDFVEWLAAQAAAVRARRWADIDVEHLAEEIDGLAGSDRREVRNRLRVLVAHILKTIHQPERQSDSWENTIREQGYQINSVLEDSPSLRRLLPEFIARMYPMARRDAAKQTRLGLKRFPQELPKDVERRVMDVLAETS